MLASSLIYFYSDVRCCRDEIFYSNSAPCRAASNLLQWPHGAEPQIRILRIQLQTVSSDFPTRGNTWGEIIIINQHIMSLLSSLFFCCSKRLQPILTYQSQSRARRGWRLTAGTQHYGTTFLRQNKTFKSPTDHRRRNWTGISFQQIL